MRTRTHTTGTEADAVSVTASSSLLPGGPRGRRQPVPEGPRDGPTAPPTLSPRAGATQLPTAPLCKRPAPLTRPRPRTALPSSPGPGPAAADPPREAKAAGRSAGSRRTGHRSDTDGEGHWSAVNTAAHGLLAGRARPWTPGAAPSAWTLCLGVQGSTPRLGPRGEASSCLAPPDTQRSASESPGQRGQAGLQGRGGGGRGAGTRLHTSGRPPRGAAIQRPRLSGLEQRSPWESSQEGTVASFLPFFPSEPFANDANPKLNSPLSREIHPENSNPDTSSFLAFTDEQVH